MAEEMWVEGLKEVICPIRGDRGYLTISTSKYIGKTIRITVEELELLCCEKWRGKKNVYAVDGTDPLCTSSFVATYCPECGRKLREG